MIYKVTKNEQLNTCLDIIHKSFQTVADDMNLTKEICAYLRLKLSQNTAVDYFQAEKMSNRHEMISQTRNLSESVSGGFVYRYEFDIAFDYENSLETGALESKGVNVEFSNIEFEL